MNDNTDLLPNLSHDDDIFEVQLRGYSRRQVDEFVARCRSQIRDMEQRLSRALDESEDLRRNLASARQQALGAKPAHEEVSERIAQILKLADDEARSQKAKAQEEIAQQLKDAQAEADRVKNEAREQAERMLTAAQEQAERAITAARAEAEKTRNGARTEAERMTSSAHAEAERMVTSARAEAERTVTEAQKKADAALSSAKAQAKKALDEATARATAIHDGAERRLNLLSTRHADTMHRLADILEGVSALVAAESARPSLEDEVSQVAAKAIASGEPARLGTADEAPAAKPQHGTLGQQGTLRQQGTLGQQGAPVQQPQQAKPAGQQPARPGGQPRSAIDPDEATEGVRVVPGTNLRTQ